MANPKPRSVCWPFSKQRSGFPNAGATINRRAEFTLSLCARPSDRVLVGTVIQHRNEWMDSPRSGDEYPVCGRYRFQCVCVSPLKHWLSAAACRQHRFRCCAGMLITMKKKNVSLRFIWRRTERGWADPWARLLRRRGTDVDPLGEREDNPTDNTFVVN